MSPKTRPSAASASSSAALPTSSKPFLKRSRRAARSATRTRAASRSAGGSALARRLRIPYWTVDADVVVPSRVFNRSFALLHHFRPRLKAELPKYLVAPPSNRARTPRLEAAQAARALFSFGRHHGRVSKARPPDQARRHVYRRHTLRAQAPPRICRARSRRLRRNAQPPRNRRHQPPVSLSAFRQHRPADHCAGRRESRRCRQDPVQNQWKISRTTDRLARVGGFVRAPRAQLRHMGVRRALGAQNARSSTPPTRVPTATHSPNWSAPKPTTTYGTPPSAK